MDKSNKDFIRHYLVTALWSSTDLDNDEPLDRHFDLSNIDLPSIKQAVKDCNKFINEAELLNLLDGIDHEQAGHDFWLTRNRHGAGFWDRGLGAQGEALTELSHSFSEINPYSYDTDNGKKISIE